MKIVIWTGPAWVTWGPASLLTGIGGSETAAIHMAQELARLGHEVEVIGQVTPQICRGVKYVDYRDYVIVSNGDSSKGVSLSKFPATQIECDVFVSSRALPALRLLQPKTRLSALWMHDVHVGPDPHGFMGEYGMVLVLSEYAREAAQRYYPAVPRDRFVLTRNGIDPSLFQIEPHKEGCKVVYSSSPDRGLDRLLDYWPAIREICPEAELHVYYGFDTWERMAELHRDKIAKLQIEIFRTRMENMADQGVVSHGRVGQAELAKAYLGASMWLYPTNFHEVSCITAMEAQAAMALPITTKLGALIETVKFGCLIDPPNSRAGYREEFLVPVRDCVEKSNARWAFIEPRLKRERKLTLQEMGWDGVAKQWEALFNDRLDHEPRGTILGF